jgi:hypothetical protein
LAGDVDTSISLAPGLPPASKLQLYFIWNDETGAPILKKGVHPVFETARIKNPAELGYRAQEDFPGLLETSALDILDSLEEYAREKPISVALWALGIGFFLGWKLKPW